MGTFASQYALFHRTLLFQHIYCLGTLLLHITVYSTKAVAQPPIKIPSKLTFVLITTRSILTGKTVSVILFVVKEINDDITLLLEFN